MAITAKTKATISVPLYGGKALPMNVHTKTKTYEATGETKTNARTGKQYEVKVPRELPKAEWTRSLVFALGSDDTGKAFRGVKLPIPSDDLPELATLTIDGRTVDVHLKPGHYGKQDPKPMRNGTASVDIGGKTHRVYVEAVATGADETRLKATVTLAKGGSGGLKAESNPFG